MRSKAERVILWLVGELGCKDAVYCPLVRAKGEEREAGSRGWSKGRRTRRKLRVVTAAATAANTLLLRPFLCYSTHATAPSRI